MRLSGDLKSIGNQDKFATTVSANGKKVRLN